MAVEARQVFLTNGTKLSIEKFISNQNDLSYGSELIKYSFVPKILALILNQIVSLKNRKFIDTKLIHSYFHTADNWNETYEEVLYELKKCVNRNKYDAIIEVDNIFILVEMLYDWLEYNVSYIFDIIKIAKLLETEAFKIDSTWRGTLHENMIMQMESVENRIKVNNFLKQTMRTIEYETLLCIAEFLNEIYPDFEENSGNFNECLENICFRLFGFKHEDIHASNDLARAENILIVTRKFMDLFEFMIVLLRDVYPSNDQVFKKTTTTQSQTRFGNTINASNTNSQMFKNTSVRFFNTLGENEYKMILQASLNNPEKDKHTINKEKFMLNIYQSLGRYFSSNVEGKFENIWI